MHGGNKLVTPALPQICKADSDNQKGFEPFPQRDHKGLDHGFG
jgi:hypothetical protein